MDNFLYTIIPLGCFAIFSLLKSIEQYYLSKKTDTRSRIKFEVRRPHYEEDHNNRFTKGKDSTFLWASNEVDEGITRKLENQLQNEEYYE